MEMIAASKMKRAQNQALKGRPYLQKLSAIIADLVFLNEPKLHHPLLEKKKKVSNATYIFVTANRGLCGSYNTNVLRTMLDILKEKNEINETVITVGRKGRQAMERIGKTVLADFENIPDKPSFLDTIGISRVVIDDFLSGKTDEVWMVYNHFYSTLSQKPAIVKLLPIEPDRTFIHTDSEKGFKSNYTFEPSEKALLNELLQRYVETMVYQMIVETVASEQSARMIAMRQASDNAHEIVSHLTLHYNKARQAKITTQILEVVAGSKA